MQLLEREEVRKNLSIQEAMRTARQKQSPPDLWKWTISAFIVFFCFSVVNYLFDDTFWEVDLNKIPHRAQVYSFVYKTAATLGWYQYWALFCPHVRHSIYHETALITYEDGSMKLYEFPRINLMNHWERVRHDKLRKLFSDNLPWNDGVPFRADVCRFLARANSDPGNAPHTVQLIFNFTQIPAPDSNNWCYRDNPPLHTFKDTQFTYQVQKNDLGDSLVRKTASSQSAEPTIDEALHR